MSSFGILHLKVHGPDCVACKIETLQARLAEAERAIENAGRCLVLSNNGPREALEILRGYKATADMRPQ